MVNQTSRKIWSNSRQLNKSDKSSLGSRLSQQWMQLKDYIGSIRLLGLGQSLFVAAATKNAMRMKWMSLKSEVSSGK